MSSDLTTSKLVFHTSQFTKSVLLFNTKTDNFQILLLISAFVVTWTVTYEPVFSAKQCEMSIFGYTFLTSLDLGERLLCLIKLKEK